MASTPGILLENRLPMEVRTNTGLSHGSWSHEGHATTGSMEAGEDES